MTFQERLEAFVQLGTKLSNIEEEAKQGLFNYIKAENNWFSNEAIEDALQGIIKYLDKNNLEEWGKKYKLNDDWTGTKVGVIMAGNIPAVGFHDFLSVLISGHTLLAKLSSKDSRFLQYISKELIEIAPAFEDKIQFPTFLKEADAFIATGSDNTARHFEYYFASRPNIIRRNRIGISVFDGTETKEDFLDLGKDIFTYYGLGCRNVAKVWAPKDYDFIPFYDTIEVYKEVIDNHKYANNYEYHKAIYLVKQLKHLDNGFLLLKEDETIASPTATLFYEFYSDKEALKERIDAQSEKIQCITSKEAWYPNSFALGDAQKPGLFDYADGVDTMAFLEKL